MNSRGPQNSKRTIFIGSIPYDAKEQELSSILQLAGPFETFRLKHDSDTHQSKGYGFVEYRDAHVASSALWNLNKYEMNGRALKVDYASDNNNGVNLKPEETKERDAAEIKVESDVTVNLYEILKKQLSAD